MIKNMLLTVVILLAVGFFAYGSYHYIGFKGLLNLETVVISGNHILSEEEILSISQLYLGKPLKDLDYVRIQSNLESLPWVKAVSVYKVYPAKVRINIRERVPVALVQADKLYGVDEECVVLPLVPGSILYNVPVLTGFGADSGEIDLGIKSSDLSIHNAVGLVLTMYLRYPELYHDLSEIHRKEDGSIILYSLEKGTTIHLGNTNVQRRLEILSRFRDLVSGNRSLSDYGYLDLRWNNQIVAKERL